MPLICRLSGADNGEATVSFACRVLARFPDIAPKPKYYNAVLKRRRICILLSKSANGGRFDVEWEDLRVVRKLLTVVIRQA